MELILWRHAEAEDASAAISDEKRRLTIRGDRQASVSAKWLRPRLPKKTRILVSPTLRTQHTAHALSLPFEIEPAINVGASVKALLSACAWPGDDNAAAVLVGHQPVLGQLAAQLLCGRAESWSFKKGAIWWFYQRQRNGREQTILRAVINPELLI